MRFFNKKGRGTPDGFGAYLRALLFSLCGVIGFLGAFNFLIDPHGIYRAVSLKGINSAKVLASKDIRMQKAYAVVSARPQTIILGTSREEGALDPTYPGFQHRPVYNMALPAATVFELSRYLQHSHAVRPLKQVVLALEFSSFMLSTVPSLGGFREERLSTVHSIIPPRLTLYKTDLFPTLFSLESTKQSIATIKRQGEKIDCLPNGMRDWNMLLRDLIVSNGGALKGSGEKEEELARILSRFSRIEHNNTGSKLSYLAFGEILDFCHREQIELIIMIPPVHARWASLLYLGGLGGGLDDWKRQLVAMNTERAKKFGQPAFPLWDFSVPHEYTMESVPRSGGEMRWFWESSHYKKELGDVVLARIFPALHTHKGAAPDFGILLSPRNIATVNMQMATATKGYCERHPQDVADLMKTINKIIIRKNS